MEKFLEFAKDLLVLFIQTWGPVVLLIMLAFHKEIRESAVKHRKLVRAIVFIVIATTYLNIGWACGTYFATRLGEGMSHATILQKFLIGPNGAFVVGPNPVLLVFQIAFMIIWPFWLAIILLGWLLWLLIIGVAWMAWLVKLLCFGLWRVVIMTFKIVFAGGIAKLFGVG
jgi:hypothetical protein